MLRHFRTATIFYLLLFGTRERKKGKEEKNRGYHHEFCKEKRISNYRKLDVLILTILSGVAIKCECREHAPLGQKSI